MPLGETKMNDELFKDLEKSMKQAVDIANGDAEPARTTEFELIDFKALRQKRGLTQIELAEMMAGGLETVRKWESGKRNPTGLTKRVLKLLMENDNFYNKFKSISDDQIADIDVGEIRWWLNLTQSAFAEALFVSLATAQKWEQGKRKPTGLTRKLLILLKDEPKLLEVLAEI